MTYKWDQDKPDDITKLSWRRQQIENFLDHNPGAKPKDVFKWIEAQEPNPWPSCKLRSLATYIRRLRQSRPTEIIPKGILSICRANTNNFYPSWITWDRMPPSADL